MEKMNLFEMQAIAGGISQKEYCKQLGTIMANCDLDNGGTAASEDTVNNGTGCGCPIDNKHF